MLKILSFFTPKMCAVRFKTLNKCRTSIGLKPLQDYKLLYKAENIDVSSDTDRDWLMPHWAETFNIVKVGKRSDPTFSREIISFYDKDNNMIERLFRQNGMNTRKEIYSKGYKSRTIVTKEFVQPKIEAGIKVPLKLKNLAGRWRDRISELQIIEEYPVLKQYIKGKRTDKSPVGLYTKRVEYSPSGDKDSVRNITFTKYPINFGFQDPSDKKVISGTLVKNGKDVELTDVRKTDNLKIDLNDEFLKYRFIDPRSDEGLRLLTDYFIKKRGLEPLHIYVNPSSGSVSESSLGYFWNGELHYSKRLQKLPSSEAVDTVAHEVEHAYQHAQIGRLGKSESRYETEAERLLPPIETNEIKSAVKYAIARDVYPVKNKSMDNPLYRDNYLEVKAREAGGKAKDMYQANKDNYEFFNWFGMHKF